MASLGIDMITKKPRTARDPYTTLTDTQIKNIPRVRFNNQCRNKYLNQNSHVNSS